MIERLARALEHVNELPEAVQEELAEQIEQFTAPIEDSLDPMLTPEEKHLPQRVHDALQAIGSAQDLLDDDEFEALDRIRHASPPAPSPNYDDL